MSILTEPLPEGMTVGGTFYPMRTSFRVWLSCLALLREPLTPARAAELFTLVFPRLPDTLSGGFAAISSFLKGPNIQGRGRGEHGAPLLDFTQDAPLLYAAFLSAYGIDLLEDDLHFWQFLALLSALPGDTALSRVMRLRALDTGSFQNKKDAPHLRALLSRYRIRGSAESEKESIDRAFQSIF